MVVVQVRDDQLVERAAEMPSNSSAAAGVRGDAAAALGALGLVEAAIDQDGAVGVADHPDEIVDGVGGIVVVGR